MRENYIDEKIESAIAHLADKVAYRDNLVDNLRTVADDFDFYYADKDVSSAVRELYKLGISPKSVKLLLAQMGVDKLQAQIDCN